MQHSCSENCKPSVWNLFPECLMFRFSPSMRSLVLQASVIFVYQAEGLVFLTQVLAISLFTHDISTLISLATQPRHEHTVIVTGLTPHSFGRCTKKNVPNLEGTDVHFLFTSKCPSIKTKGERRDFHFREKQALFPYWASSLACHNFNQSH